MFIEAPNFELIHFEPVRVGTEGEAEFADDGSLLAVVTETTDLLIFDVVSWEEDLTMLNYCLMTWLFTPATLLSLWKWISSF